MTRWKKRRVTLYGRAGYGRKRICENFHKRTGAQLPHAAGFCVLAHISSGRARVCGVADLPRYEVGDGFPRSATPLRNALVFAIAPTASAPALTAFPSPRPRAMELRPQARAEMEFRHENNEGEKARARLAEAFILPGGTVARKNETFAQLGETLARQNETPASTTRTAEFTLFLRWRAVRQSRRTLPRSRAAVRWARRSPG
jgi:hypothetical protein